VCKFTGPNTFSPYLKAMLHPKYSVQGWFILGMPWARGFYPTLTEDLKIEFASSIVILVACRTLNPKP